jgi:phosphoribosylformylglycinamidine cyclo-ligase
MADKKVSLSYRDAGVDIDAANVALAGIKELVRKTYNDQVLCDIGSFGAMYLLDLQNMEEPVLVSSVDGVAQITKLPNSRSPAHILRVEDLS